MSPKHQNIHFSVQHEDPRLLSFLDVQIYHITNLSVVFKESKQLVTFSLKLVTSFITKYNKSGLLYILIHGSFSNPEINHLKLVSAIFYQIFIFSSNDRPSKIMKNVFYFI